MGQRRSARHSVKAARVGAQELEQFGVMQRGIVAATRGDRQTGRENVNADEAAGDRPQQGAKTAGAALGP